MFLKHGPAGSPYDHVIVGSGPAGMSLAVALADARTSVLLMESGGDTDVRQDLANTVGYGHYSGDYWNRHSIRTLGGTSRVWSGWVAALDDIDFDNPVVGSRWPIRRADLLPFYEEAAGILDRDPSVVHADGPLFHGLDYRPFSLGPPTRLDDKYRDTLQGSQTLHVATGCTMVALEANAARSSVTALDYVYHPSGARRRLALAPSQSVVLAAGGIGNAQLLLQPVEDGGTPVGNESGLVGRFLMEHPHLYDSAECVIDVDLDRQPLPERFGGGAHALRLSADAAMSEGLFACSLECREKTPDHGVARYLSVEAGRPFFHYKVTVRSEMLPEDRNRVFLTGERDEVGLLRPAARCVVSARDLMNVELTLQTLGALLIRNGRGRVRVNNANIYHATRGGGHVMGTTRMGSTVSTSVVDAQCRVHGYDNLYVAGSSVFPTGGCANPTLTIVALSLRLAETLRGRQT